MPTSSPPLRIAVLGAGKIGSTFAFQLARAGGHEVTVIARPGSLRLRQLERDGAIVDIEGERATVQVAGILDDQTPYDLVIVTLLAHQADALLPTLKRSAAKSIQFMFNTFDPEALQGAIGIERCAFGMPFVQATLDADGRLEAKIGAAGQKTILSRKCAVETFNAAGLPAVLEPDMPLWLRCHAPLCVAFESVSVMGERRDGGASWAEASVLAQGVQACFALIEELGFAVYPRSKRLMYRSPASVVAAHALVHVAHPLIPRVAGDGQERMPRAGGRDGGGGDPAARPRVQNRSDEALWLKPVKASRPHQGASPSNRGGAA